MKSFLKNNFWLLLLYFLAVVISLFFIVNYKKIEISLYINQFVGNKISDSFFYFITFFGDGTLAVVIIVVTLLYNVRIGLYTLFSFLSATIVSTILKYFFFDDVNRPVFIFRHIHKHALNFVEGVPQHIHNSFPSGHATQAFAVLLCFAFVSSNSFVKWLMILLAILTSFSRLYLSQHWLIDVLAGSMIGMFFSILYYFLIIHKNKIENLNRSFFALTRRDAINK